MHGFQEPLQETLISQHIVDNAYTWQVEVLILYRQTLILKTTMDTPVITLSDLDKLLVYFKDSKRTWYHLGLGLGLEPETLNTILCTCYTDEERLTEMLKKWITGSRLATWREAQWLMTPQVCGAIPMDFQPKQTNDSANDLPLYTVLSDSERQQLTASLQQETSDMQKKFQELVTRILKELERCRVPLDTLIQQLEMGSQKDTLSQATSIQDVFNIADTEEYWSFFSYDALDRITWHFEQLATCKLDEYDTQFEDYCIHRLRRLPSDGVAAEEKAVMLLDSKMGLQKIDTLKLTQLKMQASTITGFTVTKLIWVEDDCPEPTLRTQHKDEGGDEEDTCSAKELDTAPTLRPPGEPHPPPQRYFTKVKEQSSNLA